MALSIALSVIATTGTGIVLGSRIVYGMASYRALPEFVSNVSRRYSTPAAASIFVGLLIIALSTIYYLATSVQNAFFDVIDVTGLLFSIFYILTALAMIVYYRRRVLSSAWDFLILGLLPLGAACFLGWVFAKSLLAAPGTQRWSLLGNVALGIVLMIAARFILQSTFFSIERESDSRRRH
jgi:amino acid transporter